MPLITFVSSTPKATTANQPNAVFNLPAGVVADDQLILFFVYNASSGAITPPSGWVELVDEAPSSSRQYIAYKIATGSEPSSYTFTWPTASRTYAGVLLAYRSVDPTTPIDVSASATAPDPNPRLAPTVTTTVPGCMVVAAIMGASINNDENTCTPPAGHTERQDAFGSNVGLAQVYCTVADKFFGPAGATGTAGFTASPDTTPNIQAYRVALKSYKLTAGASIPNII